MRGLTWCADMERMLICWPKTIDTYALVWYNPSNLSGEDSNG